MLTGRDQMFLFLLSLVIFNDKLALAANGSLERYDSVDTRHLSRVLWTTGFEKLSNTRQTASDVLGLGSLPRRLREKRAWLDNVAFVDRDLRADRNRISRQWL